MKRKTRWSLIKGYRMLTAIIVFAAGIAVHSCNEDDSPEEQKETYEGAPTPVGTPRGDEETFEVTAAGATIASSDGKVEIVIPPGAVAATTTIGIQPLENTAPNGVGDSYRLTPHDFKFAQAVIISFYYEREAVSFRDGLAIAFQDDDDIWYWPGNLTHDSTSSKVSVQSLHFSDWSLFEAIRLTPMTSAILPGDEVQFEAHVIESMAYPLEQGDAKPLSAVVPLGEEYPKEWTLEGDGELIPSGHTALYRAPTVMPRTNPVSVILTVDYGQRGLLRIEARVTVGESWITLNGGPYSNFTAKALQPADATSHASGVSIYFPAVRGSAMIAVIISFSGNRTGQCSWNGETCFVITNHGSIGGATEPPIAGNVIIPTEPPSIHPGHVKVTSFGNAGEVISGTFRGSFTFFLLDKDEISYGTVSGSFIARRK